MDNEGKRRKFTLKVKGTAIKGMSEDEILEEFSLRLGEPTPAASGAVHFDSAKFKRKKKR